MNKKILPLSLLMLTGLTSYSSAFSADKNDSAEPTTQQVQISTNDACPQSQEAKTITMKDMSFSYFKYEDHICGTLAVDLSKNKDWSKAGSGWFAAGFGAKTMKGSNMFIFVPKNSDVKNTKYNVFANIGGAYGPTKSLDTKPIDGQIKILSSSLGKVNFAIYPAKIDGLSNDDKKINMIFSHSKPGMTEFAPGHTSAYDGKSLDL
ncbi:hypothetical protein FLM55_09300 [Francisella sp. Scap27]|uniref:hypothetical protein n=1 Tax=Francisella sp. Scap27 TaxID=2589986 RepID=UPI0015BDC715|nr:hypothetical protein [Francisella sp. Scap27]QLE79916.1 hypothetical protein FLM55_09300 [Francisella sp. Scap27]